MCAQRQYSSEMRVFSELCRPLLLLLLLVLCVTVAETFASPCNSTTEYQCSNRRCVPMSKVNDTYNDCEDNSDEASVPCRAPLFSCRNNRCALKDWLLDGKDDCLDGSDETKYIGTNCSSAVSCCFCYDYVPHSSCVNDLCRCNDGYHPNERGTVCSRNQLGDRCDQLLDCLSVIDNSSCVNGFCACDIGHYASLDDKMQCTRRKIRDECAADDDCSSVVSESVCQNGRCFCRFGFKPVRNETACIPRNIHELEKGCIENRDCSESFNHSFCHNDTKSCRCNAGYVTTTGLECDARRIDDWCDVTSECTDVIPSSHCINGVCRCDVGYVVAGDRSACTKRKIGENTACQTPPDCNSVILESDCHDGTCQCNPGYLSYADNSTCLTIGDYMTCSSSTQNCNSDNTDSSGCYEEAADSLCDRFRHTTCVNSTCLCRSGYHLDDDVHSCILRKIGDETCALDADCYDAVNNSGCQNGTCVCQRGYKSVIDNTTCQLLTLGDSCSEDIDCQTAINSSFCGSGSCMCLSGYNESFLTGRADCKKRRIGDATCTVDSDCSDAVTFSECVKNVCLCGIDFLPTENGTICKNRTVLRQFDRQLIEEFRNCSDGEEPSCFCSPGFARRMLPLSEEKCHRAKGFLVEMNFSSIVGKYDWMPLRFNKSFISSEPYDFWHYTWRLQHSGMSEIILNSSLSEDFLSVRILQFSNANPGVKVKFAIFFLRESSVTGNELSDAIRNYLVSSETELGQSKINVFSYFLQKVPVLDLNECQDSGNESLPLNDCDPNSICSNTVGYFECVCGLDYKDEAVEAEFKGRNCTAMERDKERKEFEKLQNSAGCTNGQCETPWDLVIIITIGTFTLLLLLLIGEVVSQTKHVRNLLIEKRKRTSVSLRRMTMMQDSEQLLSASASLSVDNETSRSSNDTAAAAASGGRQH